MGDTFIRAVWDQKDTDHGNILIWLFDGKSTKESHWFTNADAAEKFVAKKAEEQVNVFMGAGLQLDPLPIYKKGLKSTICGIPGLWLDLDIKGPDHAKPNLPKNASEVKELLSAMPDNMMPSIIVHSGHGVHAWWLFKEVWTFDASAERKDAEHLEKRLIYFFKAEAKKRNWDVDSVYNLDRVMRVPGTTNYKSIPVKAKLLETNDNRYDPSEFDWLPDVEESENVQIKCGAITLNPEADPPFDKFKALEDMEPRFGLTYERKRKDLQDQSASSYDMSLANYAVMYGWTDQEVVDLLISFRRKHAFDLKLREDYYMRTLNAAKKGVNRLQAQERIAGHVDSQEVGAPPPSDENEREARRQDLSASLGVQIIQIKKYTSDPPTYKLITNLGEINLGPVDGLIGQAKLRNSIAAATGRYMPRFKSGKPWDDVAQTLLDVCTDVGIGDDATEAGETRNWLAQYLSDKPVGKDDEATDRQLQNLPYTKNDITWIFGPDFQKWVKMTQQEKLTAKRMGYLLKEIGCSPSKLTIYPGGQKTTRSVWQLPKEN